MFKRIYFILIAMVLLGIAGCKKEFLTKNNPTATTDDNWWNLESDLIAALAKVYEGLPSGTVYDYGFLSNTLMHRSGVTDETIFRANFDDWQDYPVGAATTQEYSAYEVYKKYYGYIRNACRFIENYQKAYVAEPAKKQRFGAEARALRAYYHLQLFMLYGPIPIVDHSITPNEQFVKRNTQDEVIAFIASEFDSAAIGLPTRYPLSDTWRIARGACYSMQAQLYMYVSNYAKAKDAARKVIDLNMYGLHPNYEDLFKYAGSGNGEEILYKSGGQREAFFRNAPKSFGCQATNSPTQALVNTYETLQGKTIQELGADSFAIYNAYPAYNNNRDPRLKASIAIPGEVWMGTLLDPFTSGSSNQIGLTQSTQTGYWIKKYVDPLDRGNTYGGSMNFMLIRYAEVLLSYVEALIELDDYQNPDVITYLNAIRNRAGMPGVDQSVYNTKDKLRELVRRERMVELSFEGPRLYDIRRWKIGSQVLNGVALGAVNPATGKNVVVEQRVFNEKKDYLWPIPLAEITSNKNIEQNDGW
jgi:hypothetical protein